MAEPNTLEEIFQRYRRELNAELRAIIGESPLPLYQMLRYHLGWVDQEGNATGIGGGKALRPILCLLTCEAVGGTYRQALPVAAALELIHNFSLIHDDIEDASPQRRHRPTVWKIWGVPHAINTGDAMHVLARRALLRLAAWGVASERILKLAELLDETSLRICEGQFLDMSFETRMDVTLDDYLDMAIRKTGALFEASLVAGALLGGTQQAQLDAFRLLGLNLGLAFQMRDDVLGIWGHRMVLGKSTTEDIISKKKSLPIVLALEGASAEQTHWLQSLYGGRRIRKADAGKVLQLLDVLCSRERSKALVERYVAKAHLATDSLPIEAKWKDSLHGLLDELVKVREE